MANNIDDLMNRNKPNLKKPEDKIPDIKNIPLNQIHGRDVNEFSQKDIAGLAKSISEIGLAQPIIVREENKTKFVIVAGHRRWNAIKLINNWGEKKINRVLCRVLSSDEVKNEEQFYVDTNLHQREQSIFEKVYRMYPNKNVFNEGGYDEKMDINEKEEAVNAAKRMFIILCEKYKCTQDYYKFNTTEALKYYGLIYIDTHPKEDVKQSTIEKYVSYYFSCTANLRIQLVAKGLSAREISTVKGLEDNMQDQLASELEQLKADDKNFNEKLQNILQTYAEKKSDKATVKEVAKRETKPITKLKRIGQKFLSQYEKEDVILLKESKKDIKSEKNNDLAEEYYDALKKVLSSVEKLEEAYKKAFKE